MKTYIRKFGISLCLLGLAAVTMAQEIRTGLEYSKDLAPKWEGDVQFEFRKNLNGAEKNIYNIVQTGLDYELTESVKLSGSVRYAGGVKYKAEIAQEYYHEYRFTTDITYDLKRLDNDVKLSTRLRYQYTSEEDDGKQYLRNKLECAYEITNDVEPYLAVEPYYSLDHRKIRKFRVYMGSKFEVLKQDIEVYIISEGKMKDDVFGSSYSIGFTYAF